MAGIEEEEARTSPGSLLYPRFYRLLPVLPFGYRMEVRTDRSGVLHERIRGSLALGQEEASFRSRDYASNPLPMGGCSLSGASYDYTAEERRPSVGSFYPASTDGALAGKGGSV